VWLRSSDLSNTPSMMRGLRSEDQTHPDAACTNRLQPTQESSQPGSPAEDNNARRSAQPWLQVAKRSDRQQQNASSSSATNQSGCRTSAQGSGRKRGCRGHGALKKRAQQRRQKAAASQDQRDAQGRSDSNGLDSIASAMQSQSEAIMAMAQAVQQLSKQISNFLFAQRQSGQQRQQQRGDNNLGKTAELNKKGEREWDRIEGLARAKLVEIRTERERQAEQKSEQQNTDSVQWKANIEADFDGVEEEIQKAMRQEREYQRCDYRRTHCKALELLVSKYNRCSHMKQVHHNIYGMMHGTEYTEAADCVKYSFDHYGMVVQEQEFLVDPERFFSYDLVRARNYNERPL
jgi:hypothetical protein